jgi:hypothetical protein
MKKAFDIIKNFTPEQDVDDTVEDALDDDTLWEDLQGEDEAKVRQAVDRHSAERLSCFAHTLQLVVKDGLSKSTLFRGVLGKCSKMASPTHQSTSFRESFEKAFGSVRSIPAANETRWSSTFMQFDAIASFKQEKLSEMLRENGHNELVFTAKEHASLLEMVDILRSFADATNLLQGDSYATLGCVVPTVVFLYKHLEVSVWNDYSLHVCYCVAL